MGTEPSRTAIAPPRSVTTDRDTLCREVLESLPAWFGRPHALDAYVTAAASQPMLACFAEDRAIVGILSLKRHGPATVEIHVLGVKPVWHRRGIGRALVEAAVAEARTSGQRLLTVKTLAPSHPDTNYAMTRRFYEALGFLSVEEFPTLWGAGTPCLLLALPIAAAGSTDETDHD